MLSGVGCEQNRNKYFTFVILIQDHELIRFPEILRSAGP